MKKSSNFTFIILNKKTLISENIEKDNIPSFLEGKKIKDFVLLVFDNFAGCTFIFQWPQSLEISEIRDCLKRLS